MQAFANLRSSSSSSSTTPMPPADNGQLQPQAQPQPQPNDPVVTQPVAAVLLPMPFPGPYAYAPGSSALEADETKANPSAPPATSRDATPETTSSDSTTSSTTTANSTVAAGEPGPVKPDDNPDGLPPLILAASQGNLAVLNELLSISGINVDMVDENYGSSALMFAAQNGHLHLVARLLNAGADANLINAGKGWSALTFAVRAGKPFITNLLLAHPGIRLDHGDRKGRSLLQQAACSGHVAIAEALLKAGASLAAPVTPGMEPLFLAVKNGHLEMVRLLLRHRPVDINQIVDAEGGTLLLYACFTGVPGLLAFLLEQGANVNRHGQDGSTPLAVAAFKGDDAVLALLLQAPGIDLNCVDNEGNTPLSLAAGNGHTDVVVQLIAAGAKVNVANGARKTALMKAADDGFIGCVQALLKHPRIEVDQRGEEGETALMLAASSGHAEVVRALLLAGADADLTLASGDNAFTLAVLLGNIAVIEVLAEYGMPLAVLASESYSMEEAPFLATAEDLIHSVQLPVDPDTNPLGLRDPALLGHPRAFLAGMLAKFERLHAEDADTSFYRLTAWLGEQGIRRAASITMLRCLVDIPTVWAGLAHAGTPASTHQKLLYCASAMTRMPMPKADRSGAGLYEAEKISRAALKRLSLLANRQIDRLVALAEQVLAESGATMLDELVGKCLAETNLEYQVGLEKLKASLVGAGFYLPLAEAIALSWQAAIGSLQTMPIHIPPGLNLLQTMRFIHEHTASHAPTLFAAEMQRQLAGHRLLENLRTTMGEANDEGLHALFQIQCDQLRQFCEQLLDTPATTANTSSASSTSSTSNPPRQ